MINVIDLILIINTVITFLLYLIQKMISFSCLACGTIYLRHYLPGQQLRSFSSIDI